MKDSEVQALLDRIAKNLDLPKWNLQTLPPPVRAKLREADRPAVESWIRSFERRLPDEIDRPMRTISTLLVEHHKGLEVKARGTPSHLAECSIRLVATKQIVDSLAALVLGAHAPNYTTFDVMEMTSLNPELVAKTLGLVPLPERAELAALLDTNATRIAEHLISHVEYMVRDIAEFYREISSLPQPGEDLVTAEEFRVVERRAKTGPAPTIRFVRDDKIRVNAIIGTQDVRAASSANENGAPQAPRAVETSRALADAQRIEALLTRIDTLQQQVDHHAAKSRDMENDGSAEINRSLRARLRALEVALASKKTSEGSEVQLEIPTTWDKLNAFADEHLAGRVHLSSKAIRAAKASEFSNVPFVYEVLLALAQEYVPARRGEPGAYARFEETCSRLRIEIGHTGTAAVARRTRDAYHVQHLGKSLRCDMHVQGSSSRDIREGFRLYFAYVEEADQSLGYLVVGHMPEHLRSTLS